MIKTISPGKKQKKMEIIIGILALIIAILTFKFSFFKKPTKELELLKVQFRATQKLSKEVEQNLILHIRDNNASNEILFGDITCEKYLIKTERVI